MPSTSTASTSEPQGTPSTTPRPKRGKGWTRTEDECLVKAWLDISQDPERGTSQRASDFWERIFTTYERLQTGTQRTASALETRWKVMQKSVNKFCGAFAAVEQRNESGKTHEDKVCCIVEKKLQQAKLLNLLHLTQIGCGCNAPLQSEREY